MRLTLAVAAAAASVDALGISVDVPSNCNPRQLPSTRRFLFEKISPSAQCIVCLLSGIHPSVTPVNC